MHREGGGADAGTDRFFTQAKKSADRIMSCANPPHPVKKKQLQRPTITRNFLHRGRPTLLTFLITSNNDSSPLGKNGGYPTCRQSTIIKTPHNFSKTQSGKGHGRARRADAYGVVVQSSTEQTLDQERLQRPPGSSAHTSYFNQVGGTWCGTVVATISPYSPGQSLPLPYFRSLSFRKRSNAASDGLTRRMYVITPHAQTSHGGP